MTSLVTFLNWLTWTASVIRTSSKHQSQALVPILLIRLGILWEWPSSPTLLKLTSLRLQLSISWLAPTPRGSLHSVSSGGCGGRGVLAALHCIARCEFRGLASSGGWGGWPHCVAKYEFGELQVDMCVWARVRTLEIFRSVIFIVFFYTLTVYLLHLAHVNLGSVELVTWPCQTTCRLHFLFTFHALSPI